MIPQQHKQNIELVYSERGREFFKKAQEKLSEDKVHSLKTVWASKGPDVAINKFLSFLQRPIKLSSQKQRGINKIEINKFAKFATNDIYQALLEDKSTNIIDDTMSVSDSLFYFLVGQSMSDYRSYEGGDKFVTYFNELEYKNKTSYYEAIEYTQDQIIRNIKNKFGKVVEW